MSKYIEHILMDLVRDTKIDYDEGEVYFPFTDSVLYLPWLNFATSHTRHFIPFAKYCTEKYGLTENEIKHLWYEYKFTVRNKTLNNE